MSNFARSTQSRPVLRLWQILLWGAASAVVLAITAPSFQTIAARSELLIIPREAAFVTAAADLARLPGQLSFYERVLRKAPELRDPWVGESVPRRLDLWNRHIAVERLGQSNVIRLTVYGEDRAATELLARTVNTVVAGEAAYHYGAGKVDIHPLDGPVLRPALRPLWAWILLGLAGGALVTALLSVFIRSFGTLSDRWDVSSRERTEAERIRSILARDIDLSAWPQAASIRPAEETRVGTVQPEKPATGQPPVPAQAAPVVGPRPETPAKPSTPTPTPEKTSAKLSPDARLLKAQTKRSAPTNLPGVDASRFSWDEALGGHVVFEEEPSDILAAAEVSAAETAPAPRTGEPSQEDFKRRLNELLQGKM